MNWIILRARYIPTFWPVMTYFSWKGKNEIGVKIGKLFHYYKNGDCQVIWEKKNSIDIAKHQRQYLLDNINNLKAIRKEGFESGNKIIEFCKGFNGELKEDYKQFLMEFEKLYQEFTKKNMLRWLFTSKLINEELKSILDTKYEEVFPIMSLPEEISYSQKEEIEFFELVKNHDNITEEDIQEFVDKYYWFPYEYIGPNIWTLESVKKRIKENVGKQFKPHIPIKEHEEIIEKYKLNQHIVNLFEVVRTMSLMQDDRKMLNSHICYYLDGVILKKLSDIIGCTHAQVRYIDFDIFDSDGLVEELKRREKHCICMQEEGVTINSSNPIPILQEHNINLEIDNNITEIKGQVGSKGKVTGKVRVLRHSHIEDFNEGDIIVTGMTTPDFVPLIRKASAIITDEGGITCHAAIISRELEVPCIIGTKIATKVLKDGDLVEVDAEKGVVRKL